MLSFSRKDPSAPLWENALSVGHDVAGICKPEIQLAVGPPRRTGREVKEGAVLRHRKPVEDIVRDGRPLPGSVRDHSIIRDPTKVPAVNSRVVPGSAASTAFWREGPGSSGAAVAVRAHTQKATKQHNIKARCA